MAREKFTVVGKMKDGWTRVMYADGDYGFINKKHELMKHKFKYAKDFHQGMAVVQDEKGFAYVRDDGVVLPYRFTYAFDFMYNLGLAYYGPTPVYVVKDGTVVKVNQRILNMI